MKYIQFHLFVYRNLVWDIVISGFIARIGWGKAKEEGELLERGRPPRQVNWGAEKKEIGPRISRMNADQTDLGERMGQAKKHRIIATVGPVPFSISGYCWVGLFALKLGFEKNRLMAEFNFYSSQGDWREIIRAVLAGGNVSLIPYTSWPSRQVRFIRDYDEAIDTLMKSPVKCFYIWGDGFSKKPPFLLELNGSGPRRFTLYIEYGGPGLCLNLPKCFNRGNKWFLNQGDFFRPRVYWEEVNGIPVTTVKVSDECQAGYLLLKREIKSCLNRLKVNGKTIWIGHEAKRMVLEEDARINVKGWHRLHRPKSKVLRFVKARNPPGWGKWRKRKRKKK